MAAPIVPLTAREQQVCTVVLRFPGRKTEFLAHELGMSPHTLRNHLGAIFRKLDLCNRVELLVLLMAEARKPVRIIPMDTEGPPIVIGTATCRAEALLLAHERGYLVAECQAPGQSYDYRDIAHW